LAWAWWFPKVRKAAESVDNTGTVKLPDNSRVENSPNAVLDMVYPSGGSEQHVTGHVKISNTSRPRRIAADSKKIRATKWNFAGISIPQVAVPQGFTGPFFSENKPAKSESHRQ
jgi:hypothetical protein